LTGSSIFVEGVLALTPGDALEKVLDKVALPLSGS